MSTSAVTPRTADGARVPLWSVLGQRNIWLVFVLGFATGLPAHTAWQENFSLVSADIDKALFLSMTGFGIAGIIGFAAAPLFDRYRAPGFARFGHRKSWVVALLCAALVLFALLIGTKLASEGAALRFGAISGAPAIVIAGAIWIAVDALRIDLYRGRAQSIAISAMYFGSLSSSALLSRLVLQAGTVHTAIVCGGLLVLGLGAVLLMREPETTVAESLESTNTPSPISYTRPWTTFFARNGHASPFLLAAIACYALAGSVAEYLGRHGYTVDLLRTDLRDYDATVSDALSYVGTQTTVLTAAGIVAGMLIALTTRPARAFRIMMISIAALVASFIACKAVLGFTVYTLPALYVIRTLVWSGAFVIYISVAAHLTARPNTAGHVAIISVFGGVFWVGDDGLTLLAEPLGTSGLAAVAAVAATAALLMMHIAARVARPAAPAIDRA